MNLISNLRLEKLKPTSRDKHPLLKAAHGDPHIAVYRAHFVCQGQPCEFILQVSSDLLAALDELDGRTADGKTLEDIVLPMCAQWVLDRDRAPAKD